VRASSRQLPKLSSRCAISHTTRFKDGKLPWVNPRWRKSSCPNLLGTSCMRTFRGAHDVYYIKRSGKRLEVQNQDKVLRLIGKPELGRLATQS